MDLSLPQLICIAVLLHLEGVDARNLVGHLGAADLRGAAPRLRLGPGIVHPDAY